MHCCKFLIFLLLLGGGAAARSSPVNTAMMINSVPNKPKQTGSTAVNQSQSQHGINSQKSITTMGSQKNNSQRDAREDGPRAHGASYVPMGAMQTPDKVGVMGERLEEYNASAAAWQSPTVSTPTSSAMHMQGTPLPPSPPLPPPYVLFRVSLLITSL